MKQTLFPTILIFLFLLVCGLASPKLATAAVGDGFWSTRGGGLVDRNGNSVRIAGTNWGWEVYHIKSRNGSVQGELDGSDVASYRAIMNSIKNSGFNAIRFYFVKEHLDRNCNFYNRKNKNPELKGLSCLQVMDKIIDYANHLGLKIILDHHTITDGLYGGVDYSTWLTNWRTLAARYKGNPTVIGADLANEPNGLICWKCGGRRPEWKTAAENAANRIHIVNPDWLMFIETTNKAYSLVEAKNDPVKLTVPNKLVYSVHDYSATHNVGFDDIWGFMAKEGIAPVFVGEFQMTGPEEFQLRWMRSITSYMRDNNISGATWAWRYVDPEHSDTLIQIQDNYVNLTRDGRIEILADWVKPSNTTPPDPPSGNKQADANDDGHVTIDDLEKFWLPFYRDHHSDETVPNGKANGDFNGDKRVDGVDYAIWYSEYER